MTFPRNFFLFLEVLQFTRTLYAEVIACKQNLHKCCRVCMWFKSAQGILGSLFKKKSQKSQTENFFGLPPGPFFRLQCSRIPSCRDHRADFSACRRTVTVTGAGLGPFIREDKFKMVEKSMKTVESMNASRPAPVPVTVRWYAEPRVDKVSSVALLLSQPLTVPKKGSKDRATENLAIGYPGVNQRDQQLLHGHACLKLLQTTMPGIALLHVSCYCNITLKGTKPKSLVSSFQTPWRGITAHGFAGAEGTGTACRGIGIGLAEDKLPKTKGCKGTPCAHGWSPRICPRNPCSGKRKMVRSSALSSRPGTLLCQAISCCCATAGHKLLRRASWSCAARCRPAGPDPIIGADITAKDKLFSGRCAAGRWIVNVSYWQAEIECRVSEDILDLKTVLDQQA